MPSPGRVQNRPVLVLAPFGRDGGVICSMFGDVGVEAQEQSDLPELVGSLDGAAAAVIAEEALVHEYRGALAEWIGRQPPWSDFPFVLLTLRVGHNGAGLVELIDLLGNVTVLGPDFGRAYSGQVPDGANHHNLRKHEHRGRGEPIREVLAEAISA